MEFIGVLSLFNIELWAEGSRGRVAVLALSEVVVVVAILIEQTEEGGKGGAGVGDESSLEQRHVARWCGCADDCFCKW